MRIFLGSIGAIALLAECWWIAHRPSSDVQQFNVFTTQTGVKFSDETGFPVYDPIAATWKIKGRHVASLHPFTRHWNDSPDGIGRFVIARVEEPGSMANVRSTLLSLIEQRICQVGLIDQASRDEFGTRQVLVLKIDWVRADDGTTRKCISDGG